MSKQLLLGQTLEFTGNPFHVDWTDCVRHHTYGAVLIEGSKISAVGDATQLKTDHPDACITDHGQKLILPGFVDAHVHYPQTAIIASWGKRLIDWLDTYTFPEEMRLSDPAYATKIAGTYFDLAVAHGTTSMLSFCTSDPTSVDAFFEAAQDRNMAVAGGKTCMDRHAPDGLTDTAQRAYDESKDLIERWHQKGRNTYAITPRFSPTSTPDQLSALGALWAEKPSCLMQTHISEQSEEIDWVQGLFPKARDYLDTYQEHGLLGERGVYGHAIHLKPREVSALSEIGASVAHCPTSNSFIGSGLCDVTGLSSKGINVGLATDTGGGSNFSMLRTMAAAYEIAQLKGGVLHPAQLLWLATQGAAKAMHMQDKIGNLAHGNYADIVILNLSSTYAIAQRVTNANSFWETVFPTIMMGDDRAISDVYIAGKRVAKPV